MKQTAKQFRRMLLKKPRGCKTEKVIWGEYTDTHRYGLDQVKGHSLSRKAIDAIYCHLRDAGFEECGYPPPTREQIINAFWEVPEWYTLQLFNEPSVEHMNDHVTFAESLGGDRMVYNRENVQP